MLLICGKYNWQTLTLYLLQKKNLLDHVEINSSFHAGNQYQTVLIIRREKIKVKKFGTIIQNQLFIATCSICGFITLKIHTIFPFCYYFHCTGRERTNLSLFSNYTGMFFLIPCFLWYTSRTGFCIDLSQAAILILPYLHCRIKRVYMACSS